MSTGLAELQAALAAEHAAVHVLGALGAQTSASVSPGLYAVLREAHRTHQLRRDRLLTTVTELGGTPEGAAPAYRLPEDLGDRGVVLRVARRVEHRCQEHYAAVVAATTGEPRRWAVVALRESAIDVLAVRGTPEMLPGTGEYVQVPAPDP